MNNLPSIEEFEKLPKEEQKRWVSLTTPRPLNRAERRAKQKAERRSKKNVRSI